MFLTEYDQSKALAQERHEAINEDRRRVAITMLRKNYPLSAIEEISQLPKDIIINIASNIGVNII